MRRFPKRFPWGFDPRFYADRLTEPGDQKRSGIVFCCSMGDLFGSWVNPWVQGSVLASMAEYDWHQYVVLTKAQLPTYELPGNMWIGVSIDGRGLGHGAWGLAPTDRVMGVMARAKELHRVPERKILCLEPLLCPSVIAGLIEDEMITLEGLDWMIVGGLGGGKGIDPRLTDRLVRAGHKVGVPVFVKRNARYPRVVQEYPEGLDRVRHK